MLSKQTIFISVALVSLILGACYPKSKHMYLHEKMSMYKVTCYKSRDANLFDHVDSITFYFVGIMDNSRDHTIVASGGASCVVKGTAL